MVKEYKILFSKKEEATHQFVKRVNKYISEGWEPLGAPHYDDETWHQAVIKREEQVKNPFDKITRGQ